MIRRLALALVLFAQTGAAQVPPVPEPVDAPLFDRSLWESLPPLEPLMASWVRARVPGADVSKAKMLSFEEADRILGQAVARGYAGSDVFTDAGLRTDRLFFIYKDDIRRLFERYEMKVLTPPNGTTNDGEPFEMQGLLLGGNRVVCVYSLTEFEFKNPWFPSHDFRFRDPIVHVIRGPADLTIDGAWVKWHLLWPKMNRFVKISADKVRVETSLGSTEDPLSPIRRK